MEVDQIATKYIGMVWEVSESFMQELPWTSLWNWYRCSLVPAIDFMVALPLSAIAAMDSSWQGGFQPLIASTFIFSAIGLSLATDEIGCTVGATGL